MKKMAFTSLLVVLLLSLTIGVVGAAMDMEDPALCVSGEWLLINAAQPSAVQVVLPEGTAYGPSAGCKMPPPNSALVLDSRVVLRLGHAEKMMVVVDGKQATPSVNVTYGAQSRTVKNNGKHPLVFVFDLAAKD